MNIQRDILGRKIKDSIPAHPEMMAHEITYKYRRKKIIKLETYKDWNIVIKTTYFIDKFGNWIKCVIKSNKRVKNAIIKRELTYFE